MPRPIETEVANLKRDVIRLDNEVMALKAQLKAQKQLNDTVHDFMYNQWPDIREKIGGIEKGFQQMERFCDKLDALEAKMESANSKNWKLYVAIGILLSGTMGGAGAMKLLSMLFGG